MFLQQTLIALARALPAVIAPSIIADLRLDPFWIGIYFGVMAVAALIVQLGCGSFIVRYGALRMSQIALYLSAIGIALADVGTPLALCVSAAIVGGGSAVSTPASSHLLARCSPPRYLPLVFSLKQTAVPMGLLLAGLLGPPITEWHGWRETMLLCAGSSVLLGLLLQPLRKPFDDDRVPSRSFQLSDFKTTLTAVIGGTKLRTLSFACLSFNGLQSVLTAYYVLYLTTLGYSPIAAGVAFSVATAVAVPGRIVWGWVGSTLVSPRMMMATLGLSMSLSAFVFSLCNESWAPIAIGAVGCLLSATALSWHGIVLAEIANAAPDGMRGGVTGGVLSFGQLGGLILPLVFAGILDTTGSYALGFLASGILPMLVAAQLLRQIRADEPPAKPAER